MLDIQARHHVDARVQQFLHVLPALVVPATGHDGMGQLIHQDDPRTAETHGRQVHLLERRPAVRHLPRRHHLQALRQGAGIRPAVRLSHPDHDITTRGGEPPALSQQGIRLARTRRSAQEQVQPALAPTLRYHQPLPARSDPRRLPATVTRPPRSPQEQVQPPLAPTPRYNQPLPARSDPRRLPAIATRRRSSITAITSRFTIHDHHYPATTPNGCPLTEFMRSSDRRREAASAPSREHCPGGNLTGSWLDVPQPRPTPCGLPPRRPEPGEASLRSRPREVTATQPIRPSSTPYFAPGPRPKSFCSHVAVVSWSTCGSHTAATRRILLVSPTEALCSS